MTLTTTDTQKASNSNNLSQGELVFERKREEYLENNMELLRSEFEQYLINDCDYPMTIAQDVDDGRDERLEKEKQIYIENQKENYRQEYNESMEEVLEETDLSHLLH